MIDGYLIILQWNMISYFWFFFFFLNCIRIGLAIDGFSGGGAVIKMIRNFFINIFHFPIVHDYISHMWMVIKNETINFFQMNNGQFFGQFVGKFISVLSAVNQNWNNKMCFAFFTAATCNHINSENTHASLQ